MPEYQLSPCTKDDVPKLVDLLYSAFQEPIGRDTYLGPDTPQRHQELEKWLNGAIGKDPVDYWIKVYDKSQPDKILAASNWKLRVNVLPHHEEELTMPWLDNDPERKKIVWAHYSETIALRNKYHTKPHVYLAICFCDPEFHRKGLGAMMLKWGSDLADNLFLPCWLEASKMGRGLYAKFGYEMIAHQQHGPDCVMRRPERPSAIDGDVLRNTKSLYSA